MSGNEVMVFVVFLLLGYWIVSFFLQRTNETWHRVLNINPSASLDEIRAAYQSLISQYHPDKVATLGAEVRALAERKSKEITAAYQEALRLKQQ
jgi:DnaJ like chaperone protein